MLSVTRSYFLLSLVTLLSCSQAPTNSASLRDDMDPWAKQAWLDKAARALRLGAGIAPADNAEALVAKSREEIVDLLMADPRFTDTLLDFNLYFLGFKPAKLYSTPYNKPNEKEYDDIVFDMPHALSAAKAVAANGDYFSLFDYHQPIYTGAFRKPSQPSNDGDIAPQKPDRELRLSHLNKSLALHDELIAFFNPDPNQTRTAEELCGYLEKKTSDISESLFDSGIPNQVETAFLSIYFDLQLTCFAVQDTLDPKKARLSLVASRDSFSKLLAIVDHPAAAGHIIKSPMDIVSINPVTYGIQVETTQFSSRFWNALENSSTNFNRRRSAYVLKTYFCDDLTPINIALPDSHAGNKHADDPGCAACHYKLDPMAGFFRHRGIGGINFHGRDLMIFDDMATVSDSKLSDYLDSWGTPDGSNREWNVGYIRSPKKTQVNSYGESLEDLTKILRDAKEVRQCLTRRMAEYFLGKGQVFDGEWINHLAAKFDNAAESTDVGATSKAFKAIVKELVLSSTFTTPDPETTQCYDFAPDHQPTSLPCEVAYVIKKNCASCHSGDGASGNLDLTSWQVMTDGKYNFKHTSDDNQQIARRETLKRLLERLSTNDESLLMPLNKHMDAVERAKLYKWVNREAETSSGGQ